MQWKTLARGAVVLPSLLQEHVVAWKARHGGSLSDRVVQLAKTINESITVPLFLKLHHEYASVGHLARRLVSGAQGLVLYAREPEIDISLENLQLRINWGLTPPGDISASLRGAMSVYGFCPTMPLAASGGIGRPEDLIKVLMGGADVGVIVSALYREGADAIRIMRDGLIQFMESRRWNSMRELQSNRPLEFSNDEERLRTIKGLTVTPSFVDNGNENHATQHLVKSDTWGHPVAGR